jgi:Ca2+/Na+ antiporter
MTIFWKSIVSKAVQIGIIIIEAILALSPDMSSSFFGLSMIITSLLLCVAYGVFNKHKTIKMIIVPILLYFILVFVPLSGNEKKFLMAFQWTMFICSFLFLIWMIFKDHIIKVNEYNSSLIRKYEDRTAILQVQLEKSIKAGIDLLDIIRSSDDKGDRCGE